MSNITIYHNPACGTSRNTLEMIRKSGTEPEIILYLENPPSRDELTRADCRHGDSRVRSAAQKRRALRATGPCRGNFTDDQLIDFMLLYPILINRPIVVTPLGTRLCRPSEVVLDILPDAQKGHLRRKMAKSSLTPAGKNLLTSGVAGASAIRRYPRLQSAPPSPGSPPGLTATGRLQNAASSPR